MSAQHTPGRLQSSYQFFNEGAPLFTSEQVRVAVREARNAAIDEAIAYVRNIGLGTIASDAMAERLKS